MKIDETLKLEVSKEGYNRHNLKVKFNSASNETIENLDLDKEETIEKVSDWLRAIL